MYSSAVIFRGRTARPEPAATGPDHQNPAPLKRPEHGRGALVHGDEHPHHYTDQDEQDDDTQRRPDPAAAVPVAIITTPPFCWAVRRCRRATDDTGCAISSILPTDRAAGGRWQVAESNVPAWETRWRAMGICLRSAPGRLRSSTSRWVRCPTCGLLRDRRDSREFMGGVGPHSWGALSLITCSRALRR